MGWKVLVCAAFLLSACAGAHQPDPGSVAFSDAATRCQLPYLAGQAAVPNFREGLSRSEVERRFGCLRDAMVNTPAMAQHRNLDVAAHMVQVAEFAAVSVSNGADPLIAERYYSEELLKSKDILSQRAVAKISDDRMREQRLEDGLAALAKSFQPPVALTQPGQITPFTCTRRGNVTSCQ